MTEDDRLALICEHAPPTAFPGSVESTARMIASLCPLDQLTLTPPDELREKLRGIRFAHRASTPADDDEYWLARSPFDNRFYVFASCSFGGGWPTKPVYAYDESPAWFYED